MSMQVIIKYKSKDNQNEYQHYSRIFVSLLKKKHVYFSNTIALSTFFFVLIS